MNMTAHISTSPQLGIMYCGRHIGGLPMEKMFWNIVKNAQYVRLQIKSWGKIQIPLPHQSPKMKMNHLYLIFW